MWGSVTAGMRAKVHSKNESVFFPGGLILVLALIGLAAGAVHAPIAHRPGRRDRGLLGARARPRPHGRGLSLPAAVRLRPGLGRRARAGAGSSRWRRCSTRCSPAPARSCSRRWAGAWGKRRARCARAVGDRGVVLAHRHRRRRRRAPRPPRRAPAGARRDRPARAAAGPAHRRRARPRLAVLLDRRLLQDPDRQQHVRHARSRRPARRHERLPRQGERREAALLRDPHGRAAHGCRSLPGEHGYVVPEPPTRRPRRTSRSRAWASRAGGSARS